MDEPAPEPGIPLPPEELSPDARISYYQFARVISGMKVLTLADQAALVALAETSVERRRAQEEIDKHGLFRKTKRGKKSIAMKNPALAILQDADRRLRGWLNEFGLTPASRTRVKVHDSGNQKETQIKKYFA